MTPESGYSLREVRALLGLSRGVVSGFIELGFVRPQRGTRNAYRFSFPDLVALRVAQELTAASLPTQRILRALRRLRTQLPSELPSNGLRIEAAGDTVVVSDGGSRWRPDTGQYLLALNVAAPSGQLRFMAPTEPKRRPPPRDDAPPPRTSMHGHAREPKLVAQARAQFQRSMRDDPHDASAYINFGCVLHEAGLLDQAAEIYRNGVSDAARDPLLLFNLGVVLEDLKRPHDAEEAYRTAVIADPAFADAHYNLALLYESLGRAQLALRHFSRYRQLQRGAQP